MGLRHMIEFLAIAALSAAGALPAFATETHDFNVPAESAPAAIHDFASQAHVQILAAGENVRDKQLHAVQGPYTTDQGLHILLADTGLRPQYVGDRSIALVTSNSQTATPPTASPAATPAAVPAAAAPPTATDSPKVEEVVVVGRYEFLSADTRGTTNLPLPIEKVPQSISLVSGDFIKAADLKTLGEIAEYTPGAVNEGNQLGLGTLIKLRGFTSGLAVDGLNVQGGTLFEPDNAIFDRLEIVKGPSSVVYGVSSPGGLVNYVTKSATPQTHSYLYAQGGMWNSFRLEGQLAGDLNSTGTLRAIGVAVRDQGDSFLDEYNHATTIVYGGVNADLTDRITAFVHGGYQRQIRTSFDGIPTLPDGSPAPVPRSFCICASGLDLTTDAYHAEGDLTWHATDVLEVSVKGNYQSSHTTGVVPYGSGLQVNGDVALDVLTLSPDNNRNYGVGLSSIYKFDALGLKNSFVSLAALYQDNRLSTSNLFAGEDTGSVFADPAILRNQLYGLANTALASGPPYVVEQHLKTTTISAQSVLQLLDPLAVLLGASYSKPDVTQTTGGNEQDFSIGGQTSYRFGITYEVLQRTNAYVSYSQSFNPQLHFTVSGVLPPIEGDQYEAGVKYRSEGGHLLATGAVFRIKQKNQGQYDQTINGIDYFKPIGEVTHKGFELTALGQLTPDWQVNAGYTYLDATITSDSDLSIVGKTELFLPNQTASAYSTYTVGDGSLSGVSVGGGIRYVAAQKTAYDGSTKDLPGYVLVDASLGYAIHDWLVQVNARNIFDRHYLINNYQTLYYGNAIGEPANVSLSVRYRF
jgi:TonB-dependent siderophore receptor